MAARAVPHMQGDRVCKPALVDRPRVGRELLEAMERQTSPMVQVTLAEVLLDAGVYGSRPAVERLLEKQETDPTVREYLRDVMRSSS